MADYYVDFAGIVTTKYQKSKKKKKTDADYIVDSSGKVTKTTSTKKKDIAPVKETKKESKMDFFQKGAFDDGYQIGDVTKSILGTAGDIGSGIAKGILGIGEGLTDLASYGVSGIADKVGADEFSEKAKKFAQKSHVNEWFAPTDNYLDQYSVLGKTSEAILQGVGQVGTIIGTAGIGAAAGLGAAGTTALTTGMIGLSGTGSGIGEAYEGGATDEEAVTYGLISGASDAITELIFGGLGKAVKATGLSVGLSSADDMLAKKVSSMFSKQISKNITQYGIKAGAEGFEEVLAGTAQAVGKKLTYMSEEDLKDILEDENLLEQFIVGSVTSGIAQSGAVPGMKSGSLAEANKTGRDFISGLTQNEQAVVDKVYKDRIAENEGKLSGKEKAKIYDSVISDMEKGYLDTDTIESVLGGNEYGRYQTRKALEDSLKDQEKKLTDEIAELRKAPLSIEVNERFESANKKLSEVRDQLSSLDTKAVREELDAKMDMLTQNDMHLRESYNEKTRRGQAFEADLTKYDSKQQEVVKRAVESGILNNTNRTHDFVDMVAKISADKGVLFDFANNEKLKESGFAVDGKTINGFVKDGNITLNIDSAKSLNSIVGHEITHVLEGTDLYVELQKAVKEYAVTKGEYDARFKEFSEVYKNIENANVENELTSEFVGDYLFTDADFINNLSTKNPNIFKKIFDEIKYLCKIATAGSKEARQLEKVKRAFEKAYRENVKATENADADAKYSVSDSENNKLTQEQAEYFKDSKVRDRNGNLLKVYHTTKNDFTVFDKTRKGEATGDANTYLGFFFTDDAEYMQNFPEFENGKTESYYLDMKNPIDMTDISREAFMDIVEVMGGDVGDASILFDKELEAEHKRAKLRGDNNVSLKLWNLLDELTGEFYYNDFIRELQPHYDELMSKGYDGVIHYMDEMFGVKEYIVLDSHQAKLTSNTKPTENADIRYSLSDSNGRKLSEDQAEYFKDSKVRDENGNLKVMYHGTSNGGHTVFDTYGGNFGLFGQGAYFTDNKSVAESYTEKGRGNNKQVYEAYLNIKNPLDMDAPADAEAWKKANPNIDFPDSGTNEDFFKAMKEYFAENEYPRWEAGEEAWGTITEMGYDGITHIGGGRFNKADDTRHRVFIAYEPEQIKNIDNVKPTENPDIRYSLSDESDISYSLSFNADIAKGQKEFINTRNSYVTEEELDNAQEVTNAMVDVMMKYSSILPEDKIGKVLTKNGSYDYSVENTTICVRTLAYNEFVDKVQEEIGRPLSQMESFLVSQKLYDIATEPQCLYCYVSLDRKAFNDMLLRYMSDRDTVIDKYKKSDKTPETIKQLYDEFLHGRKDTPNQKTRFNDWIKAVDNGTQLLSLADIATEERQAAIKANGGNLAEQLKDARKYAQSASWSKIQKNYVAYRDEILKLNPRVVKNLNDHYGMRWYSFSDYSPAFIVENMQQITDAAIRGLKGLSYTKDTDFAEVFAPSGMNINISMFVNTNENGEFYIDEKQSANLEKAIELREKYPNVGIVATVTNDEALRWAGEQPWTDVIIPFHIVRTGSDVAEYYKWLNYTSESGDTIKDADLWNAYVDSLNPKSESARKKVSKNIYPNEHKNDKTTYLTLCENRGLSPRFARFAGEDWYMKLVNETRLSAEESSQLKPVYNLEAAKSSFDKFIKKGGYEGGWYKDGVDVDAEAQVVAEDVLAGRQANEVSYGRQDFAFSNINRKANRRHGFSLSGSDQSAPVGSYNVYGKDIALQKNIAPITETTHAMESVSANEYAPMTEAEAMERDAQQSDRIYSLDEADMTPEMDAPYSESITPDDPLKDRNIEDVGNRKVNAYMFENPEVKPFFQEEAQMMLGELRRSVKGERNFNDQLYYDTSGESGWFGTKRMTSDEISYLLDNFKYTYADIEKGLLAIIEDNGKENNAISKRIEFMLDERLRLGYKYFETGDQIPANQEYINLLNAKQITEYSDESWNNWLRSLPEADIAPAVETQAYEAIKPRPDKLSAEEAQWAKNKMALASKGKTEHEQIAKVLDEEPKTESQRNNRKWAIFKANVLDKGAVFEDLSLRHKNRELMGKWNYTLYSEARAQRLMGSGTDTIKSLNQIREEVGEKGLTQKFSDYMYHLLNMDRMTLERRYADTPNKPVFGDSMTAEKSAEIVKKYEANYPRFKFHARDVYSYMAHLRNELVLNGVISQETADLWKEMYPHYVPIRRVGDTGLNINVPLDTGRTGVNAPIKKAVGGNRDILPLFDTMAMRTMQTYKATAKNSFGVELKNTLGSTIENAETNIDEVIDSIDTQESLLQEGKNGKRPTFTVFEDGERVTFEITEDMYDALKPVSSSSLLSKTITPLNVASNLHRGVLTEYNPVFMLTNAIKDTQDVLINSQHPVKTYIKIPEANLQLLTKGYWYKEYMENGGDQNSYFDNETNMFKTENKGLKKILDYPPFSTVSAINNYIEMIPRLAEYIASREAGRSVEVSMLDAARVTTNFRAGGDLTKFINRNGGTFLNASVQGAMQQIRNVREAKANGLKGWVSLATKFAIAGLPAILLNNFVWDDDEEYEELSDYVKQNYYVVGKYDDGRFIRIPKGRTLAVIQNAIEQISNAATGNDEADLKSFLELAVSNLAPNNPLENNILAPIKQVLENETWYGEDLVPSRLADLPASEQFDESTDSFSRWLGSKLDISPVKINYLLDQYSGGVGDVALPMLTPKAESGDDTLLGNFTAPLKDKFTTDSVMNNQNVSDFYDTLDTLTTNAKMSNSTDEDVLKNKYFNSIKSEMNELYAEKRELQNSGLSNKDKYNQVREIQKKIDTLAEEALNNYASVEISGTYATVNDRQYRLTDEGEWTKITDKQLEKQDEVTKGLGISPAEYWSNKTEYDYAYESPDKYALAKSVGGYDIYKKYTSELYDIKADKDKNGKSINGSRKEKVIDYINNLDADYETKIILFKSEYNSDDTHNYEIIEYLNNREDISYDEMVLILKELGFNVDSKGNVTWD